MHTYFSNSALMSNCFVMPKADQFTYVGGHEKEKAWIVNAASDLQATSKLVNQIQKFDP